MPGEDLKGFIAGWFAGCVALIATHPIDTVRVSTIMTMIIAGNNNNNNRIYNYFPLYYSTD